MAVQIIIDDVFAGLASIPDESVDCVITSPPYWGLRDYGVEGQIGLEPTLGEHMDVMVRVCREIRRTLKPWGTFWFNYGDCYATTPNGRSAADTKTAGTDDRTFRDKPFSTVGGTFKPKDLCMLPNRLAIALHDDGWAPRSEIIWGKPNPMPDSSGAYRPSTSHEKIFLFAKDASAGGWWRARDTGCLSDTPDLTEMCPAANGKIMPRWRALGHYYDAESVRLQRTSNEDAVTYRGGSYVGGRPGPRKERGNKKVDKQRGHSRRHQGFNERWDAMTKAEQQAGGRNLRNYEPAPLPAWDIATHAFSEAHFATFPPELAQRCILAGCPDGGTVLDPFGGAGTTGLVADRLGRNAVLIEINPEYAAIARNRIDSDAGMLVAAQEPVVVDLFAEHDGLTPIGPIARSAP